MVNHNLQLIYELMLYKGRRNHQKNSSFIFVFLVQPQKLFSWMFSEGVLRPSQLIVGLTSCQTTVECLGFRPQYAGGVWKRYIFVRFSLPSTLIRPSRKRNFMKTFSKPEEFLKAGFAFFVWTEKVLKATLLVSDDVTTSKCPADCWVFKILRAGWCQGRKTSDESEWNLCLKISSA